MDLLSVIWIFAFSFLLTSLSILYSLIRRYLDDYPEGSKSIYHVVARITIFIFQTTGSVYCILAIVSKLNYLLDILNSDIIGPLSVTLLYEFSFFSSCISLGCIILIRLMCLINITFMEETIGEFGIILIHFSTTFICGVVLCGILVLTGDILTVTAHNLMTRNAVPMGNNIPFSFNYSMSRYQNVKKQYFKSQLVE